MSLQAQILSISLEVYPPDVAPNIPAVKAKSGLIHPPAAKEKGPIGIQEGLSTGDSGQSLLSDGVEGDWEVGALGCVSSRGAAAGDQVSASTFVWGLGKVTQV